MYCSNCGKEISMGDVFCSGCSSQVSVQNKEKNAAAPVPANKFANKILGLVASVIVFFFGVMMLGLFSNVTGHKKDAIHGILSFLIIAGFIYLSRKIYKKISG